MNPAKELIEFFNNWKSSDKLAKNKILVDCFTYVQALTSPFEDKLRLNWETNYEFGPETNYELAKVLQCFGTLMDVPMEILNFRSNAKAMKFPLKLILIEVFELMKRSKKDIEEFQDEFEIEVNIDGSTQEFIETFFEKHHEEIHFQPYIYSFKLLLKEKQ